MCTKVICKERERKNRLRMFFILLLFVGAVLTQPILAQADSDTEYTVEFYTDSRCSEQIGSTQTVKENETLGSFEDYDESLIPEGEAFLCWTDGRTNFGDGYENTVTKNLKLYPKYTKSYIVTFKYKDDTVQKVKVRENQKISEGTLVESATGGDIFDGGEGEPTGVPNDADKQGWYTANRYSSGTINKNTKITGNTIVNSNMTVYYVATYNLKFVDEKGDGSYTYSNVEAGVPVNIYKPIPKAEVSTKPNSNGLSIGVKYEFKGWFTGSDGNGDEYVNNSSVQIANNAVYYADWKDPTEGLSNKYTVTLEKKDCDGNKDDIVVSDVAENSVILTLPTVTKAGSSFTGRWRIKNSDGTMGTSWIVKETKVTENVTLVPEFSINNLTVTFKGGESVLSSFTIKHGEKISSDRVPTVSEYEKEMTLTDKNGKRKVCTVVFTPTGEWKDNGGSVWNFDNDTVTANLTLTAQYTSHIKKPEFSGEPGGGGEGTEGDDFDWDSAQIPLDPFDSVTVTFKPGNGDNDKAYSIKKGGVLQDSEIPNPTKANHTFQYWSRASNGSAYNFESPVNSDVTLYAVWKKDINIIFNSDGGDYIAIKTIPYNSTVEAPEREPIRKHYTFKGWSLTRQQGQDASRLSEVNLDEKLFTTDKQILWAWYESRTRINFHFEYGDPEETKTAVINEGNSRIILDHAPEDMIYPNDTSKVFVGWYTEPQGLGELITRANLIPLDEEIDLYAKWSKGFEVTFVFNKNIDGKAEIKKQYVEGYSVKAPVLGVQDDKRVEGWYLDAGFGEKADFDEIAADAEDVKVYAKWETVPEDVKISVTLDATDGAFENGDKFKTFQISLGEAIASKERKLEAAVLDNMYFGQWYLDREYKVSVKPESYKPSEDVTLYARWVCKVKFEPVQNVTAPAEQLKQKGSFVARPEQLTHANLNFRGWSEDANATAEGQLWDFWEDTVSSSMTLYGIWTADVNFNPNGGSFDGDSPIISVYTNSEDKTINSPKEPVNSGKTFEGWYMDEELTIPFIFKGTEGETAQEVTKNITLYAKWSEGEPVVPDKGTYQIKVEVQQGGTFESDGTFEESNGNRKYVGYFDAGDVITLKAIPYSGYYFVQFDFNKGTVTNISSTEVEFTMPDRDVNLVVKFGKTKSGGGSGSGKSSKSAASVTEKDTVAEPEAVVYSSSAAPQFSDTKDHWAEDAINYVSSRNLFTGTEENKFSPEDEMTRGMFVTVLARMSGENTNGYENAYQDVDNEAYYSQAIAWAAAKGLVASESETRSFNPESAITRQELAVLLDRYMQYSGKAAYQATTGSTDAQQLTGGNTELNDVGDIADYAKQSVLNMEKLNIITGKPGQKDGAEVKYFDPNKTAVRAEVAVIIQRYMTKIENR